MTWKSIYFKCRRFAYLLVNGGILRGCNQRYSVVRFRTQAIKL
jgi:hypothetical protein